MSGASDGALPSFLPITNRLFKKTGFRTVMCQQFGLCLSSLRKPFRQDLGNPLVAGLPRALEE
jgi:hypothetical protein